MDILLLTLSGLAFFGLLIWLLSFYWRRVIDNNITSHFRAAESITEYNKLPDEWITDVKRKTSSKIYTFFGLRKRSGIGLLLQKLDNTTKFFDEGSFYADNAAKEILLEQLKSVRKRVSQMTWDELLIERDSIRDIS